MQISRRIVGALAALLMAASLVVAPNAGATQPGQGPNYTTHLFGRMEVPVVDSPGFGWSTWQVEGGRMYYRIAVARTEGDITAAHLHMAEAGANGPVVVGLDISDVTTIHGGSTTVMSGFLNARDFVGDLDGRGMGFLRRTIEAGDIYINVHSSAHPSGELRGQLS